MMQQLPYWLSVTDEKFLIVWDMFHNWLNKEKDLEAICFNFSELKWRSQGLG